VIGVFDSGFGGLTVHRALIEALPERDFLYLGDNRNAPYGARPPIEVLNLTCAAIDRLFAEGCALVVLACNTASTVALRWIQQQWLPARRQSDRIARNVIGVVAPTIEAATALAKPADTIAIFATRRTVETDSYPTEIRKRRPDLTVAQQSCPDLAGAIERGLPREHLRALIERYVADLLEKRSVGPGCVILACTHYPLVADLFAAALPSDVSMIHQPEATAVALRSYLDRHPEYDRSGAGRRAFLSTGFTTEALPLIERFWGGLVPFNSSSEPRASLLTEPPL
jgi:glutamate racemase